MKSNSIYTLLVAIVLLVTACSIDTIRVAPDDTITTKDVTISDFEAVEIANNFKAYITFSDTEEHVEIEANENLHKYITATIKGNRLIVRLKNHVNIKGQETLNVYITTKSITDFKVAADSNIYLENALITEDAKIKITADSFFSGEVRVDDLQLIVAADARADLNGYTKFLDANLSADAKLSDFDLEVDDLKIKMSADCNADITVNNSIDIEAFADCRLRYKGNATVVHEILKADSKIIKVD